MMEFWPEHQGQSPLYAKFGTVPGRNCSHNYHDRHQVAHYPFYLGEQQDQSRESGYWTVPGTRTAGGLQHYVTWTDPEPPAPTSSNFPFILDRHSQPHQVLGEYQPHDPRGREWTPAQRAARDYERGFQREGWQRRWEPSNPVRYSREVSAKRSEGSYRELEAWAARYSQSLPRRRHREAELRGAPHVLLEAGRAQERDGRGGTDPQVAALQHVRQSESGGWERGGRQQTPSYYPQQAPAPETSHMLDVKEKAGYQRRVYSQPPGYIAPPPYNSPHKTSPLVPQCDTSPEQVAKPHWSQPAPRMQDTLADWRDTRKEDRDVFTKLDRSQLCAELQGYKQRGPGTEDLQGGGPIGVQNKHRESLSSPQQPRMMDPAEDTVTREQTSSQVIEGRKFRLNKKTGGMTIFCLVSRIASGAETPSLPFYTPQTNIHGTEFRDVCKDPNGSIHQTGKVADEVDFRAQTLTEQSDTSGEGKTMRTESEKLSDDTISEKAETGDVSPEKPKVSNTESTFERQVAQPAPPVSLKYPLWREPSLTSRSETESSPTALTRNSEEGESEGQDLREECAPFHPINLEVRRLDIKRDTGSEDSEGLLVIDTTCVVVKMELIPTPRKDHVHFLGSTRPTEGGPVDIQSSDSAEFNSRLNQDVPPHAETNQIDKIDRAEVKEPSDFEGENEPGGAGGIASTTPSPTYEKETLQEREERILGITLNDRVIEEQPEDATTPAFEPHIEKCHDEVELCQKTNALRDGSEQVTEDTRDEEQSENHPGEEEAVDLNVSEEALDQVQNEEPPAGLQKHLSEENVSELQLETDTQTSQEVEIAEDDFLGPAHEAATSEQIPQESQNDCVSPCNDLSHSSSLSHSDLTSLTYVPLLTTKEDLEGPETSSLPDTPSHQLPPSPAGSTYSSPGNTPQTCPSPIPLPPPPPPLDLIDPMIVAESEDHDGVNENPQLADSEIRHSVEDMEDQEVVAQNLENEDLENGTCVEESHSTEMQQVEEEEEEEVLGKKHPQDLLAQTLEVPKEDATELSSQCPRAEDSACVQESHMSEEHQLKASEDSAGLCGTTSSQENATASEQQLDNIREEAESRVAAEPSLTDTELSEQSSEILQENCENHVEEKGSDPEETEPGVGDSCVTEVTSHIDPEADNPTLQETPHQVNGCLQDAAPDGEPFEDRTPSPPGSDCQASGSPSDLPSPTSHKTEVVAPLHLALALNSLAVDVGLPETIPPPLQSDSESDQSADGSTLNPALGASAPAEDGDEGASFDSNHKEPQYPKSLWDAVNRIRKHTAPDSENEEEEVSEQWGPESMGEDFGDPDLVFDMNPETIVFNQTGLFEVVRQDPRHKEPRTCVEDDTLSCSSNSSRSSGDTIVVADEDQGEGTPPEGVTESKMEECSQPKDDSATEEDEDLDAGDKTDPCPNEDVTMEITEMGQKELKDDLKDAPSTVPQVQTMQ